MSQRHVVCPVSQLPVGGRKIVEIGGRSVGVFNVKGRFYALRNSCPHQQAPLCLGKITGTAPTSKVGEYNWIKDGEIIRCPWHGWEFDITSGASVFNPHRMRVKSYEVAVEPTTNAERGCAPAAAACTGEPDAAVESYPVNVEAEMVVVYV